jgi:hypothetical protein
MIYVVDMGSVAMVYISSFIKTGSGILEKTEEGEGITNTQTKRRSHKPTSRK